MKSPLKNLFSIPIGILAGFSEMLYLDVLKNLSNQLNVQSATRSFMEAIEFRQRLFRTNRANACFLDPYDLISDHLMLRTAETGEVAAYVRVSSASACRAHDLEYPVESAIRQDPVYAEPYSRFKAHARESLHMSLLCLDPQFKAELQGLKIVDLMIWLGFRETGRPRHELSFTATPNAKYNQDPWLKKIGQWTADLPDFVHPVIPEKHRLVLIPELSELYWKSQDRSYAELYNNLKNGAAVRSSEGA